MSNPIEPNEEETKNMLERARNEAISIAAKSAGCTTEEIEAWLEEDDGLRATWECLSMREIDSLPFISETRLKHVNQCEFCKKVIKTLCTEKEIREILQLFKTSGE